MARTHPAQAARALFFRPGPDWVSSYTCQVGCWEGSRSERPCRRHQGTSCLGQYCSGKRALFFFFLKGLFLYCLVSDPKLLIWQRHAQILISKSFGSETFPSRLKREALGRVHEPWIKGTRCNSLYFIFAQWGMYCFPCWPGVDRIPWRPRVSSRGDLVCQAQSLFFQGYMSGPLLYVRHPIINEKDCSQARPHRTVLVRDDATLDSNRRGWLFNSPSQVIIQ